VPQDDAGDLLRVLEVEANASFGSNGLPRSTPATKHGPADAQLGLLSSRTELSAWEQVLSAAGVQAVLERLDTPPKESSELFLVNNDGAVAEPLGVEQDGSDAFASSFEALISPLKAATVSAVARVSRKALPPTSMPFSTRRIRPCRASSAFSDC